jgi:hypothetical protein
MKAHFQHVQNARRFARLSFPELERGQQLFEMKINKENDGNARSVCFVISAFGRQRSEASRESFHAWRLEESGMSFAIQEWVEVARASPTSWLNKRSNTLRSVSKTTFGSKTIHLSWNVMKRHETRGTTDRKVKTC